MQYFRHVVLKLSHAYFSFRCLICSTRHTSPLKSSTVWFLTVGPRAYHGCATVGGRIYVMGGFDGMSYFNSCRCFDPITKTWLEVAPMNACRYGKDVFSRLEKSILRMGFTPGGGEKTLRNKIM